MQTAQKQPVTIVPCGILPELDCSKTMCTCIQETMHQLSMFPKCSDTLNHDGGICLQEVVHQLSSAPQHSLAPEELTARTQETLRETECQTEAFKQQYVQAATQLVGVKVGPAGPVCGGHSRAYRLHGRDHFLHQCMLQHQAQGLEARHVPLYSTVE